MAPRITDRRAAKIKAQIEESTEVLEAFGLEKGDTVRFRLTNTQRWTECHVIGENADGSLHLGDIKRRQSRSIKPEKIEKKTHGPRGGVLWVPLVPA
jgi:hypothetical protein